MRIAFVNGTHIWSGVKTWCIDNAAVLTEQGNSVFIYGYPGAFIDKARSRGLTATPFNFGADFSPRSIFFFIREFKRHRIELCVCNVSKDMRSAGIAARLLGIPIVQHLGAAGDLTTSRRKMCILRMLGPFFVMPSNYVKKGLLTKLPELAHSVMKVILPGVVISASKRDCVHSPRVITMTSRLSNNKGHAELFYALEKLKNNGFDFQCRIIGKGTDEQKLKRLCTSKGLDERVTFTGFVTNIPEQLAESDIYVFPSINEGLGIALQEAMASGLPCIAKLGSGPEEIWPECRRSMLIPEDDDGELLHIQLKRLLEMSDEDLLEEGRIFRENALQNFEVKAQAEKLAQWFESIITESQK